MSFQHLLLRFNEAQSKLKRALIPGSTVEFVSTTFDGTPNSDPGLIDQSSVSLLRGNDILLLVDILRSDNVINFTSKRGKDWDKGEMMDLSGVFPGPGATIKIAVSSAYYEISFNENPSTHRYYKRINADATALSYYLNPGVSPVFSNPIYADVFFGSTRLSDESAGESADASANPAGESADAAPKSADVISESTA